MDLLFGTKTGDHILIQIESKLAKNADIYDNWNEVGLSLSVGAWRGKLIKASLLTVEIEPFLQNLETFLENPFDKEVSLKSMEEWINLKLKGNSLGHIEISGRVQDDLNGNSLEFSFEIDQTYLKSVPRNFAEVF